jgi:hypothetical protein
MHNGPQTAWRRLVAVSPIRTARTRPDLQFWHKVSEVCNRQPRPATHRMHSCSSTVFMDSAWDVGYAAATASRSKEAGSCDEGVDESNGHGIA